MLKVINFFAEPSAGKSTTAFGLSFLMKQAGCRVELVTEYAKDLTYEKDRESLKNQEKIFKEQAHRQRRLVEANEFIITDSPLVLGIAYTEIYGLKTQPRFEERVIKEYRSYDNFNIWVKRTRPYRKEGRNEEPSMAEKIQGQIRVVLHRNHINPWVVSSDIDAPWRIFYMLKRFYPKSLGYDVPVPTPTFLDVAVAPWQSLF